MEQLNLLVIDEKERALEAFFSKVTPCHLLEEPLRWAILHRRFTDKNPLTELIEEASKKAAGYYDNQMEWHSLPHQLDLFKFPNYIK